MDAPPKPRKGMPEVQLSEAEFKRRFLSQYIDPAFGDLGAELERVADAAWRGYHEYRKSPRTRKAGAGFEDPEYELSQDWLDARAAIAAAQRRHDDVSAPRRILIINASSRSEHTCPGEMSKSYRLASIARAAIAEEGGAETELLNLSDLAAEYGRKIYPCKACFSTAAALCHWPCSCYPNYAIGQTQDWMNEIYPKWMEAHGVMIVTPVNWYHASSPLKLMIDRLVCADGGNPDPTRTHGKDAEKAKALELAGWDYPQHLAGRSFALVVHGDVEGATGVRRALGDWLRWMGLSDSGVQSELDRYIGYWQPYATSHDALDADEAIQGETRNAARALARAVKAPHREPDAGLAPPRRK
ncbi:MAG: flavodoxin family protein [Hyphomonadaceae bacterium]